ncbi:AAA family ATPase [Amycolatopsis sp. NPDC098790]|uniref:AAA family ATPase n=1 Tax=Amycolatopsis sp. NPDC098790 TaxID=3363939 RepID=UPI00381F0DF6
MMPGASDRPLTIGITGPHLTGKSTFISRLALELRRNGYQVATIAALVERAQRLGIPILHNHSWASTMWFITRGISDELEAWVHADVILVNGAVPDALAYYHAALEHRGEEPRSTEIAQLESLVRSHSSNYNLLFRTTLETNATDGEADDEDFRRLADRWVRRVAESLEVTNVPVPSSDHDTALELAVSYVIEHG